MDEKLTMFLVSIGALLLVFLLAPVNAAAADYSTVRVHLTLTASNNVPVKLTGQFNLEQDRTLLLGSGSYTVSISDSSVQLKSGGSVVYTGSRIKLLAMGDESRVALTTQPAPLTDKQAAQRDFLGDMEFYINGSAVNAVNHVYMEDYLYGVLEGEIGNGCSAELTKTFAVAARSFAVRKVISGGANYDLVDNHSNQMYLGYVPSHTNIINCVDATKGQVLYYGDTIVEGFYSSSNGGQTITPSMANGAAVLPRTPVILI